jgi:hypothetical protein
MWNTWSQVAKLPSAGGFGHREGTLSALDDAGGVGSDVPKYVSKLPSGQTMHFVFSTGCNAYQHWQSEILKASAWRVGQRDSMTHIVVGCNQQERAGHGQDAHTSGGGDADRTVNETVLLTPQPYQTTPAYDATNPPIYPPTPTTHCHRHRHHRNYHHNSTHTLFVCACSGNERRVGKKRPP